MIRIVVFFLFVFFPLVSFSESNISRDEIVLMNQLKVRMALPSERKPYVVPMDISPKALLRTEMLDFSNIELGFVPTWLKKFRKIRKLDLSNTSITLENLKEVLGNMNHLEVLNLSGNYFTDTHIYPMESIYKKLPLLHELNLSSNNMNGEQIGSLSSLKKLSSLDVSGNYIRDISYINIKNLDRLRKINISDNELNKSPLPYLPKNIIHLDISKNSSLDRIEFVNFKYLKSINMSGSNISLDDKFGGAFSLPEIEIIKYDDYHTYIPRGLSERLLKRTLGNYFERKNNELIIYPDNSSHLKLRDNIKAEEQFIYHYLIDYIPVVHHLLFGVNYYEGSQYLLINLRSGKKTYIDNVPYFSPNKIHLFVPNEDNLDGVYQTKIYVYDNDKKEFTLNYKKDYVYNFVSWNNDRINVSDDKNNEKYFQFIDGKWTLSDDISKSTIHKAAAKIAVEVLLRGILTDKDK